MTFSQIYITLKLDNKLKTFQRLAFLYKNRCVKSKRGDVEALTKKNEKKEIPSILLCIDPGSCKSGFVVMTSSGDVLEKGIVSTEEIESCVSQLIEKHKPEIILMGDGTWSKRVKPRIEKITGDIPFKLVNEKHSTERARLRYFKENPPRGLWRLIPITMQVPKEPYDDYAAIVMAEDYIKSLRNGE